MASTLTAAGTALHLAASRGAAARTILLIDTVMQAMAGTDYKQVLAWFPLLQSSLSTLPDDPTVNAVSGAIGRAEDIIRDIENGDPLKLLREARHLLACDGLDIPLQEAVRAHAELLKQLGPNIKATAYDKLLDSLRSTLDYAMENSKK